MMKVEDLAELIRTAAKGTRYLDLNPKLVRKSLSTAGGHDGVDSDLKQVAPGGSDRELDPQAPVAEGAPGPRDCRPPRLRG
jgi:hypothetical protein